MLTIREYLEWSIKSFKTDNAQLTLFGKVIWYPLMFIVFIVGFIILILYWIGNFIVGAMFK